MQRGFFCLAPSIFSTLFPLWPPNLIHKELLKPYPIQETHSARFLDFTPEEKQKVDKCLD